MAVFHDNSTVEDDAAIAVTPAGAESAVVVVLELPLEEVVFVVA